MSVNILNTPICDSVPFANHFFIYLYTHVVSGVFNGLVNPQHS
jgi:hypothetical protein